MGVCPGWNCRRHYGSVVHCLHRHYHHTYDGDGEEIRGRRKAGKLCRYCRGTARSEVVFNGESRDRSVLFRSLCRIHDFHWRNIFRYSRHIHDKSYRIHASNLHTAELGEDLETYGILVPIRQLQFFLGDCCRRSGCMASLEQYGYEATSGDVEEREKVTPLLGPDCLPLLHPLCRSANRKGDEPPEKLHFIRHTSKFRHMRLPQRSFWRRMLHGIWLGCG
mmetsp:Transcript_1041/g.3245  ORF Transcript_1041/g.3245 Transcript_1041/m.3245 type:complete len:221 (-) Transcript_1041:1706-2368(-)